MEVIWEILQLKKKKQYNGVTKIRIFYYNIT
jgi:hypothetical protein